MGPYFKQWTAKERFNEKKSLLKSVDFEQGWLMSCMRVVFMDAIWVYLYCYVEQQEDLCTRKCKLRPLPLCHQDTSSRRDHPVQRLLHRQRRQGSQPGRICRKTSRIQLLPRPGRQRRSQEKPRRRDEEGKRRSQVESSIRYSYRNGLYLR
jgi:hypothetical protein